MVENDELLSKVLTELQDHEVLNGLVLVGSWCQFYYRILFDYAPEIPLIRTMDFVWTQTRFYLARLLICFTLQTEIG